MRAEEIMTAKPACCTPSDTVERVAKLMEEKDCGCIPVVASHADSRVVGVITDRDIAVRGVAHGLGPSAPVRDLMSTSPFCCDADDDVKMVERQMSDRQVRRIIVVDGDDRCVGIVSQADLARAARSDRDVTERELARVVERISEPAHAELH